MWKLRSVVQLEAPAKAEKARIIVDAEAEAERKRIDARAQADAMFAKLDAEARGQYEILAKKGAGLREIINACGGSKEAFQILLLEHLDNLAEASPRAIPTSSSTRLSCGRTAVRTAKETPPGF